MFGLIVRRLVYAVPTLLLISFLSFVIIELPPGDYMTTMQNVLVAQAGMSPGEAREVADRMRRAYGLDQPFLVRYSQWIGAIITRGDFGFSFTFRRPVSEVIWSRFGMTLLVVSVILPQLHGMDGAYAARLRRSA
jgi:peptide/nickel transport system permease protein